MIEQRSPEWHEARKGRITASSVGAILGHAPYQTRAAVLRRMVREAHGYPSEFECNAATEWGSFNEEGAALDFTLETGLKIEPAPFLPVDDWAGASPDGYVSDGALIEIKCPFGLRDKENPVFKSIHDQPHYYDQVQFQLYITERNSCHFWQWAPNGTRHEVVEVSQKWLDENLPKLLAFYEEYLAAVKDPGEHLEPQRVVIDTDESVRLVGEYDDLTEAIEQAKQRQSEIIDSLAIIADGKNAVIAGRNFTLTSRKGSISYAKAIKELAPDADLEKWRGAESSFWRLY